MRELFIYYRATASNATLVKMAALALQAGLQARYAGLQTRLMRRPETADGLHTWMETYALPTSAEGVGASLQSDIETAAETTLAPLLAGPRHTEVFIPCA